MLPSVASVSEDQSFLLHPQQGLQRSITGTHDDSILLDSPYCVSWIGPVLKVLTEGHLDGHLFEFNHTNYLEQFTASVGNAWNLTIWCRIT